MIVSKSRESYEFEEEDDFTLREIVDTISTLWEFVVHFLNLIRNVILLVISSNENLLVDYNFCAKCFRVNDAMEEPTGHSTSSTSRCLKSSTSGQCDFERIRRRLQSNPADIQTILYNQLKDLNLVDSNLNNSSPTNCAGNMIKQPTSTSMEMKKEELEPCKVVQYREAILKYGRITFSDFTSLFNKFVRENGRDFSKADLLHWFDRFTKFIYLKRVISGEPTDVREQLSFRAIQSKRDSLAERLYNLREPHEMDLTLEEFRERLKNSNIDPVNKLLNLIKGSGDINMLHHVKNEPENKSTDATDQGDQLQNLDSNCSTDITKVPETSNEIRAETIDLERESTSLPEKKENDLLQQTTEKVKSKNRKKRASKSKQETAFQYDRKDLETTIFKPNFEINPFDPKILPPARDQSKCINSTIYITRNGFVKVSQHLETTFTKRVPGSNVYEQARSINFYVDHLDDKEPLPAGIEVKPLPPGGLDDILRSVPPMTNKEYAEFNRISSLHGKKICPVHLRPVDEKPVTNVSVAGEQVLKDKEHSPDELNVAHSLNAQPKRTRAAHKNKTPKHQRQLHDDKSSEHHSGGISRKADSLASMVTEEDVDKSKEQSSMPNTASSDHNNAPVRTSGKVCTDAEDKTQRSLQARRRRKSEAPATPENKHKELTELQTDDLGSKKQQTEASQEQRLFDQLLPLTFIDTDTENEARKPTQEPVYLETNATIDYSRHVVEPSHGDRPNKKRLQSVIKEKIKTKGEANKHLKAKQEIPKYYFDDQEAYTADADESYDNERAEMNDSATEQAEETSVCSLVISATDKPQILDNREYMMVPEEIIRLNDPRLKDIEDKYSVAGPNDKKDRKKRKDKKGKAKKNIQIEFASDFHHK